MDPRLATALISGVVALLVSFVTGLLSYSVQRRQLEGERLRFEADQRRALTTRLLEKRLELYPGAFAATEPLRRTRLLKNVSTLRQGYLQAALDGIDEWSNSGAGLMLSTPTLYRLWDLRATMRWAIEQDDDDGLVDLVYESKRQFRSALWADLHLLFAEDSKEVDEPWVWNAPEIDSP
jgi:hypothetical protein